jgi:hypothetical protein
VRVCPPSSRYRSEPCHRAVGARAVARNGGLGMARGARAGVATVVVLAGVLAGIGPAAAQGTTVGGTGAQYYLNDQFTGRANIQLTYGEPNDEVYVGDWDGNGSDTLMVRRGITFFARNSQTSGPADVTFSYGDPGDTVLVGDWDGNGTDTLAVRRGSTFFVKNSVTTGRADSEFVYGNPGDTVLVGDWDSLDGTRSRSDVAAGTS